MSRDIRHQETTPCCGKKLNASAAVDGDQKPPDPGDLSVCAYCGSWLTYEHGPSLRLMRQEEIDALDEETTEDMWRATRVAEITMAQRP